MNELQELIDRLEENGVEFSLEFHGDQVKVVYEAYLIPGARRAVGVRAE